MSTGEAGKGDAYIVARCIHHMPHPLPGEFDHVITMGPIAKCSHFRGAVPGFSEQGGYSLGIIPADPGLVIIDQLLRWQLLNMPIYIMVRVKPGIAHHPTGEAPQPFYDVKTNASLTTGAIPSHGTRNAAKIWVRHGIDLYRLCPETLLPRHPTSSALDTATSSSLFNDMIQIGVADFIELTDILKLIVRPWPIDAMGVGGIVRRAGRIRWSILGPCCAVGIAWWTFPPAIHTLFILVLDPIGASAATGPAVHGDCLSYGDAAIILTLIIRT